MKNFARTLKQVRSTLLLLLSIVSLPVTATDFITDVMLIGAGNKQDLDNLKSQYQAQGWSILNKDFNAGIDWGKGDGVLLLYKTATCSDGYNHGYITDLYLQNKSAANTTNTLNFNGRVYNLVPFDGSQHFINVKGDLNSGTGSGTDAIHLYYTKEHFADNRAITNIYINNSSSGAVGREDTHSAYNLNAGCSTGEDIFLHTSTATAPFKDCYFTDVMLIGAGSSSELSTIKNTYTSQGWKVIDYDLNKGIDWGKGEAVYLLYKEEISHNGMNHNYITDFYLQNESAANTNDTLVFRGHTYELVPYEGSQHFKNVKGDLNSGTGNNTDPIHLYYTRQRDKTGTCINGIFFNSHPEDSITVWKEGDKYPYDLNSGCSALTQEKIYMHYTIASTWKGVSPKGELNSCEIQGRKLKVNGWAYDPDESSDYILIGVSMTLNYSDAKIYFYGTTEVLDDDLNASQGITGAHGFNLIWDIPQTVESDSVYLKVYAYDLTGNDPIQLGNTYTFLVEKSMPKSALESFQAQARGFNIKGWAYNPDYPKDTTKIKVVIRNNEDDVIYKTLYFNADQKVAGINIPDEIYGNHGFNTYVSIPDAPTGNYTVFIYALDYLKQNGTPAGAPQTISITRTQPIFGLEKCEITDNELLVQGWAFDPDDSNKPIPVRLEIKNVDGSVYKTWNLDSTNVIRDDINEQYNITGIHGFRNVVKIDKGGTFNVNIYACDITGEKDIQMGDTQTVEYIPQEYDLWVGDTRVTTSNQKNILDQLGVNSMPTAVFNPETNTLTLNEPRIEQGREYYQIYAKNMDLTIKGIYHFIDTLYWNKYIHIHNGSLTLDGIFVSYTNEIGIESDNIFIKGDTVIIKSRKRNSIAFINDNTCEISKEAGYVEFAGQNTVFYGLIIAPGHLFTTPSNAVFDNDNRYNVYYGVQHIVLEQNKETYKVWIGNKQVNAINYTDIFHDGKAIFDPETNTLTLNNPTITGYHTFDDNRTAVIYSEVDDLTINGTFKQSEAMAQYCIATAGGNLSMAGDFDLTGTIAGVHCGTLKAQNGTTNLTLTGGTKASESTDIVVGNWLNPLSPDRIIINGKFYESDGSTLAKQVTLTGYATNPFWDLWLGNTQVTQFNKENILNQTDDNGKPTATFDPSSATLTLNNPDISGVHNDTKIETNISGLTIKGEYHMTTAEKNYGLKCLPSDKELCILDGNFTFLGKKCGISTLQNIIVKSGTLKAVGSSESGIEAHNLIIKEEVSHIEIEGGKQAVYLYKIGHLTCEGTLGLSTPLYGIQKFIPNTYVITIYETNSNTIAKKIIIEPGYRTFNLFVGSEPVTVQNYSDIFGDGKASFNPDNNTLTLNEPIINDFCCAEDNSTATIMAYGMNLTIKGKYNMSQANADFGVLVSQGKLTLDGDFTLYGNMCAASSSYYYSRRGVYTDANYGTALIGNIKLLGQEYGLNSSGETTLNGTINIVGSHTGLFSNGNIYIDEGTLASIEGKNNKSIQCEFNKLIIDGGIKGLVTKNAVSLADLIILNEDDQKTEIVIPRNARFDPTRLTVMEDKYMVGLMTIGTSYNIAVGDKVVTSLNCDDILGDGGKVRFDPKTNTLFMDSPEINGKIIDSNEETAKIYAMDIDFTIKGMYHMKDTTDAGLYLRNGNITLDGSFTFNSHRVPLFCPEGTLTIKSNEANNITLNGRRGFKALIAADLVFEDGMIVETPQEYEFSPSRMTIIDKGNTENRAANTIVISHKATPSDPDTTTIQEIKSRSYYPETDLWYDMYGRKLNEMPTVKGLYIHKGRIVLIE